MLILLYCWTIGKLINFIIVKNSTGYGIRWTDDAAYSYRGKTKLRAGHEQPIDEQAFDL